ncbi:MULTISPECIES: stalk domain-containing protein [Paenibacillus]|jgi:Fe-S cluster biosynthesis and repair protein YggX|uniref:stalk domain-containing protein n=1 Tax=Paenibacillus TaxID=44249 RepID=UPI00048CE1BB|nr:MULTISPECIES: stalk domain-containing protein [Paenibacillus]ALA44441.1 copper amine oxidase [Paenibacillus peoriae]MCP3745641.1 stalk domain-containing protein [Paenibacillus sp. A3M_27_13]OMF73736.1 copper amine oxidase [Paenibacillus peoriae]SFR17012.1 Copper amine oxidase N-terminal domain-containing protein [Paenibacillus sp. cl130]
MKSLKSIKKPVIITAVSALAISGALFSQSTYAAQVTKPIQAVYNNIKIIYNGTEVPYDAKTEPFLLDGVTYIPLKLAGTALDKKVTWDGTNKRVVIADNGVPIDQSTVTALNNQITTLTQELNTAKAANTTKDATIAQLQKDNQTLKDEASKNSSSSLKDLQKKLNDDHSDDYSTNSDITLDGNKSDITVTIEMTKSRWTELSDSRKRSYLEDIVDDILKEYKDADVEGTVKNSSNRDKMATFTTNSRGDVTLKDVASSLDKSSIQRSLSDRYGTYAGVGFDFTVRGDSSEAIVEVYVNSDDWNKMSNTQRNNLTDGVVDYLKDKESVSKVVGYIRNKGNGNQIITF